MPKSFGFADSFEGTSFDIFNEFVYSFRDPLVGFLPVEVILPCFRSEREVHESRSISLVTTFPFSRFSSAETSLFAFAGLRRR